MTTQVDGTVVVQNLVVNHFDVGKAQVSRDKRVGLTLVAKRAHPAKARHALRMNGTHEVVRSDGIQSISTGCLSASEESRRGGVFLER